MLKVKRVNYHRQRRWLDVLALEGALMGLVVILHFGAFTNLLIVFCATEIMYFDPIMPNYTQNGIYKMQSNAPKTLSSYF